MRWEEVGDTLCPVARTAAVIGDRWTILVVREALLGVKRFDDFLRALQVAPALLSARLKRLVAMGVLEKAAYQDNPVRYEYRLTASGRALQPVILQMVHWGNEHLGGGEKHTGLIHQGCGGEVDKEMRCQACLQVVAPLAAKARFSQALTEERNRIAGANAGKLPAQDLAGGGV